MLCYNYCVHDGVSDSNMPITKLNFDVSLDISLFTTMISNSSCSKTEDGAPLRLFTKIQRKFLQNIISPRHQLPKSANNKYLTSM